MMRVRSIETLSKQKGNHLERVESSKKPEVSRLD